VTAILKAPVDLLYNGGIGTYVKAAAKAMPTSATAPTTPCASTARAALQGGGRRRQPGLHPARAHRGGARWREAEHRRHRQLRGVDTSDHEVNIKILLGIARATAS
jgi:glutamate dehydrogenase